MAPEFSQKCQNFVLTFHFDGNTKYFIDFIAVPFNVVYFNLSLNQIVDKKVRKLNLFLRRTGIPRNTKFNTVFAIEY